MRQVIKALLVVGMGVAAMVSVAQADPVNSKTAKRQLFRSKGFVVQVLADAPVAPTTMAQVQAISKAMQMPQIFARFSEYGYYGAIAVVPDMDLSENTMAIAAKLHNPEIAKVAAIDACNAARPEASAECVAVALFLPGKYTPSDFTLSQHASDDFRKNWRGGKKPKYMAYSPATHAWSIAKGAGAAAVALDQCNAIAAKFGFSDCVIGIADE